ncbi:Hsp70 family protein [Trebonia sp.]|uniref:Hsp70 family protein n=1 Tax=Trebonia sp. TaxID=2767075 RepID=UPI00263891CA|nr:Hsp70 family protein [Trebonia sp.]
MAEPTAFGIDLGTTMSVVAQVNSAGLPVVLPNAEGSPTTPSIALFDSGHVIVGAVARESLATEPDSVVQLVKRHIGSGWTFDYGGVSYRPEHVSALILRKLVQDARLLAGPVTQAAITVPAYFSDPMRAATLRAGELAGLDVLGLLSEPTAAALAYGYDRRPAGVTGAVIDLGGGTFDVTVMEYDGADLTVRATGGDAYLGGANFDKALFDYFVEQFAAAHGLDINDPDALSIEEVTQVSQDWLLRAARAKHDLTARERTSVALQAAGLTLRVDVSRTEFVARTSILLDEMTEKMVDVVAAAGVTPRDISVVLPVGGATRMPAVRARIRDIFGVEPDTSIRPDEAVALGAGLFAAQRQLERGGAVVIDAGARDYLEELSVTDVAAHSLGISAFETSGGRQRPVMTPLLPRNTALPFFAERTFFTMRPGETQIVIPVLEGESADPDLCRRVGTVVIEHLPPGRPAHQPVNVTMSLNRDGILQVSATDVTTGALAATTIVHTYLADGGDDAADRMVRTLQVD